jgi:hypothetical protein
MVEKGQGGRDRRVRLATGPLTAGALGTVAGIVLCMTVGGDFAAMLTVAGAVLLLWGVHQLGRLGADPPAQN